jgi:hypothetical protein
MSNPDPVLPPITNSADKTAENGQKGGEVVAKPAENDELARFAYRSEGNSNPAGNIFLRGKSPKVGKPGITPVAKELSVRSDSSASKKKTAMKDDDEYTEDSKFSEGSMSLNLLDTIYNENIYQTRVSLNSGFQSRVPLDREKAKNWVTLVYPFRV